MKATKPSTGQQYFVLIVDCGGDDLVKSRIIEEHELLTKKGYSGIIGLRDVRPDFTHADIPRLELGLRYRVKTSLCPVDFVLAIMEIEAWFLAEHTHLPRIDPAITTSEVKSRLGFDPENDDMEQRLNPADDLDKCYSIGGKRYKKSNAASTVNALDYAKVYLELASKIGQLNKLVGRIETFLA